MVKETKFYDMLGVSHSLNISLLTRLDADMGHQVPPTASDAQLKTAYKKGALKYHPGMFYPGRSDFFGTWLTVVSPNR